MIFSLVKAKMHQTLASELGLLESPLELSCHVKPKLINQLQLGFNFWFHYLI